MSSAPWRSLSGISSANALWQASMRPGLTVGSVGGLRRSMRRGIAVAGALLQDPAIPIREVARQVGVSKATLYKYFPGGRGGAIVSMDSGQ